MHEVWINGVRKYVGLPSSGRWLHTLFLVAWGTRLFKLTALKDFIVAA